MRRSIPLLVICGPTASGKSAFAVGLAERLGGEIVSADSMQVYRNLDAGTAKPSLNERERVPHHLIDCVEPNETFSVSRYVVMADSAIDEIHSRGKPVLLVGGTGLYIEGLLYGLFEAPPSDETLRIELNRHPSEELHKMLLSVDPKAAEKIPLGNRRRMIRALEVYHLTGLPFSSHHEDERESRYPAMILGLSFERAELYHRINQRVDRMIVDGLLEEASALFKKGLPPTATAFQGIGYRQALGFIEGSYDHEETIRLIKRDSRRYAKRQMTWFRNRVKGIEWIAPAEVETAVSRFLEFRSKIIG